MPTLDFKGKQIIYAHHLTVPARVLNVRAGKSHAAKSHAKKAPAPSLDDNLIIHGDNLHALKALLPRYAGRVNCIYIDPPYNTGNEKWVYNDNVNSPAMREWMRDKSPVDGEDLERHDKWLCMMWPRLQLLRELLAADGVMFVSIDDNEQHRLRMVMDEIFGEENFVVQIIVQTNPRGRSLRQDVAQTHEHVLCYAKDSRESKIRKIPKPDKNIAEYGKKDEGGSFRFLRLRNTGIDHFNRETRPNLFFPIYVNPKTGETSLSRSAKFSVEVLPCNNTGREGCWTWSKDKIKRNPSLIAGVKKRNGEWRVYRKDYLAGESLFTKTKSVWSGKGVNHEVGKEMLTTIFAHSPFDYPKSPILVMDLINLVCGKNGVVLDSFAGSGTTAHATLALNAADGGARKFILIECEDYADSITAERVRRVISGVPAARDPALKAGLGGRFTYCALGDEISPEKMLTGENLPDYEILARHLVWTATGAAPATIRKNGKDGLFHESATRLYYLIYQPDQNFLLSNQSALNGDHADRIAKQVQTKRKPAMVFATSKFIGQKELTKMKITFCGLPYAVEGLV